MAIKHINHIMDHRFNVVLAVIGFALLTTPPCQGEANTENNSKRSIKHGQSNFYFGQQDSRFVPSFQSNVQNAGSFFDQNGYNSQFRPNAPDYSQQQIFNNQNDPSYSDTRFETGRQRPSPFQTQSGRAQSSSQFFLNQGEFSPLQTNADPIQRPSTFSNRPTSFQFNNHPASTSRPDFHFVQTSSHNHDPSKPETFLGQITINNPDPIPENPRDLQNFNSARIRPPKHSFGTNILRSPALDNLDFQPGFPNAPEPVNQDLYEYTERTKPTAKSNYASRVKPNRISFNSRPSYFNAPKQEEPDTLQRKPFGVSNENYFNSNENNFSNTRSRFKPKPSSTTTPHPQTERRNRFSPSTKSPKQGLAFHLKPSKAVFSPNRPHYTSTTEYKPLFDLEPLLEDEIPDTKLFGDTLKSRSNGSEDVEVIKADITTKLSTSTEEETSSENAEIDTTIDPSLEHDQSTLDESSTEVEYTTEHPEILDDQEVNSSSDSSIVLNDHDDTAPTKNETNANEDDHKDPVATEYYDEETEYVDEVDGEPEKDSKTQEHVEHDDNSEYEDIEEVVSPSDEPLTTMGETFDVLTMKPKPVMVKDDNFKGFVDSALIDSTEPPSFVTEQYVKLNQDPTKSTTEDPITTDPPPILLGEEIVSVVTTKSVINGTFKVPDVTVGTSTSQMSGSENYPTTTTAQGEASNTETKQTTPNSTESWVVVASVQTSRSVSGARFLPFPAVVQEEKKQSLAELDEANVETSTKKNDESADGTTTTEEYALDPTSKPPSTESIIDKLDRVQSELSSGFLSGRFKDGDQAFGVLTDMPHENTTKEEITTPTPPLQIFTVKSTTSTSTTERGTPEPLPVTIRKFSPYARPTTTTTLKPKSKAPVFDTIKMDDLTGLLPPGFKVRPSFKDRKITTTTEKPRKQPTASSSDNKKPNHPTFPAKNKVTVQTDLSAFLPKGYKPPKEEKPIILSIDDLLKNVKTDTLSHLLPPGYKPPSENKTAATAANPKNSKVGDIPTKAEPVDVSAFLPKGYKSYTTTEKTSTTAQLKPSILPNAKLADISAFLPPGFKLNQGDAPTNRTSNTPVKSIKIADVSALLPPGFKANAKNADTTNETTTVPPVQDTTTKPGGFKIVFPSRPGAGKPGLRLTTPKSANDGSSVRGVSLPTIHKGWPTRATTEFTGWPTPSTTPFSIEKLLEAQRAATATAKDEEAAVEISTYSTPKATSTTPTPAPTTAPTTPGVCGAACDLAATIKIVGGVKWVPELLDHNTKEWQILANEVSRELDAAYSKSPLLKKWYKGIRIDGFSKGSVLVDYFVELNEIGEKINTIELKKLFHTSLNDAKPGSVYEEIVKEEKVPNKITGRKIDDFDPDVMLGDEPSDIRVGIAEPVRERIDLSEGKLEIGKFILDPVYTEFIVLPKRADPTVGYAEDNMLLPQWGIAVIVIALASLLFVVIFGVTVLVNRQKSAKAKQPIPLSEDMLRELDKSHMGGNEDLYLQDHEPPYPPRNHKRGSTAMLDSLAYPGNPGDSWRSEWGPYYNQYHAQHYAPDSGRGSQSYTGGNKDYGYSGSQIYGYNGGGSQNYGYSGEGVRTLYPRRRSDFDSNF